MFVIRQVDPNDADNFLMSDSVHQVAMQYGWWDPEKSQRESGSPLLDFTKVYSDGEYSHKYYSGRRMWGGYRLVGYEFPDDYVDLQSDPVYPVYVTPKEKVSEQDLFRFHRNTYQGTKYDLSAIGNLAGGPFSTPDRWKAGPAEEKLGGNWERSLALYRTSDTYVVQSQRTRSKTTGAVLWFGPASPLATVFTPFIVNMSKIPESFSLGHHSAFSRQTAFWAACVTANIANLKWSYAIQDMTKLQSSLEKSSIQMVKDVDEQVLPENPDIAEQAYANNAATIVQGLWDLSDQLLFKYASGFVNNGPDDMSNMVGYPEWWLEQVGYQDGPPPPPTEPKCCNPPKPESQDAVDASRVETLTGKAAMKEYLRAS